MIHYLSAASPRRIVQQLDRSLTHLSGTPLDPATLRPLRWFWLDSLFANISVAFFATYVPLYALAYGATNAQVGQLAAVASLLAMTALFPGARLIPFFGGRKRVVLVFGGGVARILLLALACLPWLASDPAHAIIAIILLNGLIAFSNSFSNPAWTSLTADIVPAQMRGRFFAHRGQALNLVSLSVVPFAGWLIKAGNGVTGQPFAGYQLVFLLAFVTGAVATWCYSRIDEPAAPAETVHTLALMEIVRVLRRSRLFLGFVAATLIWNLGFQISLPFFNVYLAGPLGASTTTIGLLNAVMPLTALFSQRWMGRLIDRRGNVWVLTACALAIPIFPLFWILVTAPWQVIFINIPAGIFWTGLNLAAFNLLLELTPAEARADSAALYQFMVAGAMVLGPLLGGYLADAYGFNATFGVSAVGRLLGALAFVWWVARPVRRQKHRQDSAAIL
ncbi:MAG: MFS transporter [Anaerolineae bacterium]|nr:MFS transporter [Anaerolineae bacterium]